MAPIPSLAAYTALSPKQIEVIYALAAGQSLTSAAEAAGIHRSTIYDWRAQPAFRSALQSARDARADSIREDTLEMAAHATNALRTLLTDPETPPAVRLKAALSVLHSATTPSADSSSARLDPKRCQNNEELNHFFDAVFLAAQREMAASHERFVQEHAPAPAPAQPADTDYHGAVGRNAPCPCGSGMKFKRCCGVTAPALIQEDSPAASEIRRNPTSFDRFSTASGR
jgi:hypothetical protein